MKVLVVGPTWHGLVPESCARGLEALGHEARVVSSNRAEGFWGRLGRAPYVPYVTHRLKAAANAAVNREFLDAVRRFQPDLIFHHNGAENRLVPGTVQEARRISGARMVTWFLDDPFWFYSSLVGLDAWDLVLSSIPEITGRLRYVTDRPVEHFPQGCDTAHTYPEEPSADDRHRFGCDVLLVSTGYWDGAGILRGSVLARLSRRWRVKVFGTDGWRRIAADFQELRRCYQGRPLRRDEMNRAFLSAAIVLNLHHPQMRDGTTIRTFEIAGCGAFQLADHKEELEGLFKIGEELVCFRTRDELESLVSHYLSHPQERERVARRGYDRVVREHTFRHRMASLIERVGRL